MSHADRRHTVLPGGWCQAFGGCVRKVGDIGIDRDPDGDGRATATTPAGANRKLHAHLGADREALAIQIGR
jgi:hypothetical protein